MSNCRLSFTMALNLVTLIYDSHFGTSYFVDLMEEPQKVADFFLAYASDLKG